MNTFNNYCKNYNKYIFNRTLSKETLDSSHVLQLTKAAFYPLKCQVFKNSCKYSLATLNYKNYSKEHLRILKIQLYSDLQKVKNKDISQYDGRL